MGSQREFDTDKLKELRADEAASLRSNEGERIDPDKLELEVFATPGRSIWTGLGTKELRQAGIKCRHDIEPDGRETTTAEYPNNLRVKVMEGTTRKGKNSPRIFTTSGCLSLLNTRVRKS